MSIRILVEPITHLLIGFSATKAVVSMLPDEIRKFTAWPAVPISRVHHKPLKHNNLALEVGELKCYFVTLLGDY
jgi:hypothetical protein